MRNKEKELLNEIREMQNLMGYMDGKKLNEGNVATSQELKQATQDLKNNMTGGLSSQYEKNAVEAFQGMIKKLQNQGNQLTPKIKKYLQLLNQEFEKGLKDDSEEQEGAGMVKEEIIDEGLADEIKQEYNIEALIQKIAKEKNQHPSLIAIMLSKIADGINAKRIKRK